MTIKKNKTNTANLFEQYIKLSMADNNSILSEFKSSSLGISDDEAFNRLSFFNKTHKIKNKDFDVLKMLVKSFINPFSLILIFICIMTLITDVLIASENEKNYFSFTVIILIILLSGTIRFFEEFKSYKDTNKLLKFVSNTATVIRGGIKKEISLSEIVLGDIIIFGSGDIIPADIKILNSKDLFVNESSLTGESIPVEKHNNFKEANNIINIQNILFMGTNIISGTATGIVINKGQDTYFGAITKNSVKKEPTAFEKGINDVSKLLLIFMAILTPIVFILNGVTKNDWLESFLFAITVSVGLTPELLPMIVTACLSRGSKEMSKEKVIIKNLNAINNFGAIDILCTDKTGTITENTSYLDKIIILDDEYSESEVIKLAMLNASLQTGLKNSMDLAIINRFNTEFNLLEDTLKKTYIKIDEIPFDFIRKRLSVVVKNLDTNNTKIITKGSAEEMLSISKYIVLNGNKVELDKKTISKIKGLIEKYNIDGYRILILAYKHVNSNKNYSVVDECDMTIIGLLGFIDPLKTSAKKAIKELKELGVSTKILTGDNEKVSRNIANQLNITNPQILLSSEIEKMTDEELTTIAPSIDIFARLSPDQKERIIISLKNSKHKVGFMGDGINDALALRASDIGISVNDASDLAKESADVILLENDLEVLKKGIIYGRKTHFNMMKYIKITSSSNFGNMFSLLFSALFLPFLPMLSIHILILNLIYDLTCSTLPFDNVDSELLEKPTTFDSKSIKQFMFFFGPISSLFDIVTFITLFYLIIPAFVGSSYNELLDKSVFSTAFQTAWFIESLFTQAMIILVLRTQKSIFKSKPNLIIIFSFLVTTIASVIVLYTPIAKLFDFTALPYYFFLFLLILLPCYILLASFVKMLFVKKYHKLL